MIKNFNDIYSNFKKEFKADFLLKQKEINDIKYQIDKNFNKLDFYELYKNITLEKEKYLEINSYDIKYNISISNKDTERKEKLIFINTKKMRDLIDNEHVDNFFMDITYQIIPKNRKPYKLLTLSCINSETNTANICCLIGLIYEDYLSIFYCLKYLHDIYKFDPKYIHIDYSKAERKALVQKKFI